MSESRLIQAITYLTNAVSNLTKEVEGLKTEVRRLHHSVDAATNSDRLVSKEEKHAARDAAKMDRFKVYQQGGPIIPVYPDISKAEGPTNAS